MNRLFIEYCRSSDLQICGSADLQICRSADLQIFRSADLRICRSTDLQMGGKKNTVLQLVWNAEIQFYSTGRDYLLFTSQFPEDPRPYFR